VQEERDDLCIASGVCCSVKTRMDRAGRGGSASIFLFFLPLLPTLSVSFLLESTFLATPTTSTSRLSSTCFALPSLPAPSLLPPLQSISTRSTSMITLHRDSTTSTGDVWAEEEDVKPGVAEKFVKELDDCARERCKVRFVPFPSLVDGVLTLPLCRIRRAHMLRLGKHRSNRRSRRHR
jgi:hypothetical protein